MNKEERQKNREFGQFAEKIASEYYTSKGYAVREQNWRMGKTEIDLIVQKDNVLVIVEVKARKPDTTDPVSAVTLDKMRRMARAAHNYLQMLPGDYLYRFDIFALTGDSINYKIEIIEDAFLSPLIGK